MENEGHTWKATKEATISRSFRVEKKWEVENVPSIVLVVLRVLRTPRILMGPEDTVDAVTLWVLSLLCGRGLILTPRY